MMKDRRRETGKQGETLAAEYLQKQGYRILQTNCRCGHGEIDIVAQDEDCLVFVEVRTKTGSRFGTPEESITASKKAKLVANALTYLQARDCMTSPWRIDVVAVDLGQDGKALRIEQIESAVEGEE